MSESEIKEAAERYVTIESPVRHTSPMSRYRREKIAKAFISGCQYADKEAYNRCLDDVDIALGRVFDGVLPELHEEIIEELQKLRKC